MKADFQHIIDNHNAILYKIARSYTREEVDFQDLYQEMLIQLWQSYPRFEGKSKLSTWIYRVVLNTAMTFSKKQNRRPDQISIDTSLHQVADHPFLQSEKEKYSNQKIELLYHSIHELKKEERAIILLHLEGKSYKEMAEIIGITTSNIGVKITRIKKKLQELLIQNGYARI